MVRVQLYTVGDRFWALLNRECLPALEAVRRNLEIAPCSSSSSNEDLLRVLYKQILLLAPSRWLRTTHDSSVYPSVGGPMSV